MYIYIYVMSLGFLFFIQTFLKHCKALTNSTEKYKRYINISLLFILLLLLCVCLFGDEGGRLREGVRSVKNFCNMKPNESKTNCFI